MVSATYQDVSDGGTGHAEAIEVRYDPSRVKYGRVLEVFWHNIDPLTANAQFWDHGNQYRSAIFYHDDEEKRLADASKLAFSQRFKAPIVTEIVAAGAVYPAEEYHQDYYRKNPVRYELYKIQLRPRQAAGENSGAVPSGSPRWRSVQSA